MSAAVTRLVAKIACHRAAVAKRAAVERRAEPRIIEKLAHEESALALLVNGCSGGLVVDLTRSPR